MCYNYSNVDLNIVCLAAQMWNLATNLSLMIVDKVPSSDQKWECYLLLTFYKSALLEPLLVLWQVL